MTTDFGAADIAAAERRVAAALKANQTMLAELDQAVGDGDLGITAVKLAEALEAGAGQASGGDIGKLLAQTGIALNRAAASTMGTLMATALMRAGKVVAGKQSLTEGDLPLLLGAAAEGIQARGKAQLGDKTLLDVVHPASEAFASGMASGRPIAAAAAEMVAAAQEGRDRVTPLRNKIGRAGWIGERTMGKVDPGCAFAVVVLEALVGA